MEIRLQELVINFSRRDSPGKAYSKLIKGKAQIRVNARPGVQGADEISLHAALAMQSLFQMGSIAPRSAGRLFHHAGFLGAPGHVHQLSGLLLNLLCLTSPSPQLMQRLASISGRYCPGDLIKSPGKGSPKCEVHRMQPGTCPGMYLVAAVCM